ncbi:hypothetical protein ACERK3_14405 [Phycisphaerales bacterium AB-hyl4]|uniref:CopG family transcriptional regulator n=1 Tax=Natronomicrosphaera hydrolytica TaxID=3242702 RepID=A0ABV4U795_9BACT
MDRKKPLNLTVPAELAERFERVCKDFGHGKQKGVVLSAAILMYLGADPKQQGDVLRQVIRQDIAEGVDRMTERARAVEKSRSKGDGKGDGSAEPSDRASRRKPPTNRKKRGK